jgi:RNA polymerase sigma-70 factor (ECF subfamily)
VNKLFSVGERIDRERFGALVRQHEPHLLRFARRYLRHPAEAEEVTQETFLRAWQQIARFDPSTDFRAWLFTIARYLCMARLKEAKRHPPAQLEEAAVPAGSPSESLEGLRAAFDRLPPAQREVVALRLFDELSYREIARITGDTEVALRSRLHDALERLKSFMPPAPV